MKTELKAAVLASGSHLMDIHGIGPAGAARILADVGAGVIMADEPVSGPLWQRRYALDPRSVRARDTDQPPADRADAE